MGEQRFSVRVDLERSVTAIRTPAEGAAAGWAFVYAPGAGANLHDPFGVYACRTLAARGVTAVRFQFPYMEAGRRAPDRPPLLEATWRAVIEALRGDAKLCVGGRSMGGRIASLVVAAGVTVDALALFAYPLHPPGRPERTRDAHLPSIGVPTLFCSGTNDAFASRASCAPLHRRFAARQYTISTARTTVTPCRRRAAERGRTCMRKRSMRSPRG